MLLQKVILVLTHKLPAFTTKQQCCYTACVAQDANGFGKRGSGVIIYMLRRGRVRWEDWTVSFSLPRSENTRGTRCEKRGVSYTFGCFFCTGLANSSYKTIYSQPALTKCLNNILMSFLRVIKMHLFAFHVHLNTVCIRIFSCEFFATNATEKTV